MGRTKKQKHGITPLDKRDRSWPYKVSEGPRQLLTSARHHEHLMSMEMDRRNRKGLSGVKPEKRKRTR